MYTIKDIYHDKAKVQKHNNFDKLNKLLNANNMTSEYDTIDKVFTINHNLDDSIDSHISVCIEKWLKDIKTTSPKNVLYNVFPINNNTILLKV